MNIKTITFETIRWTSFAAMFAVASYGFLTPISVVQAKVYNPMLLIGLLSVAGYVSGLLDGMEQTADIHHLAINNKQYQQEICKAA